MTAEPIPTPGTAKARLGAVVRLSPHDQQAIAKARRDLAKANIAAYVKRQIEKAGPLTKDDLAFIWEQVHGGRLSA